MRLIWTTENADQFRTFCNYLHAKKIIFSTEEQHNRSWESEQYGTRKYLLWIQDEEEVEKAINDLIKFLENPQAEKFAETFPENPELPSHSPVAQYLETRLQKNLQAPDEEVRKELGGHVRLTALIMLVCSLLFLYELYTERHIGPVPAVVQHELLSVSPVRKALLFDYPQSYELLDKVVALYGYDALAKPQDLPDPGKFLYQQFLQESSFPGYYPYLVAWSKETIRKEKVQTPPPPLQEVQLIEKIRQGQLWRLWTPVLVHYDILHLFFNMVWVLILATQIEARLGFMRFLAFLLITGVSSNIAQYLMSGPNFIGFSGIICAMATYIKARQQVAPWESYQMASSTFGFIIFFISILAFLSLLTFFLDVFQNISFPIGIANTAHLVGAAVGYFLGRLRFFTWQLHN